jgi:hypothetical protein
MKLRTVLLSLALLALSAQASATVTIRGSSAMYCATPSALVNMTPVLWNAFSTYGNGATPDVMNLLHVAGCSIVGGPLPQGAIIGERQFRLQRGTVSMVNVSFGEALSHEEESYSIEGEYLGKKRVTTTSGWILKRDIVTTP